jgi:hypothetical protein
MSLIFDWFSFRHNLSARKIEWKSWLTDQKNRRRIRQEERSSETTKSDSSFIYTIRQRAASSRINNNTRTESIIINAKMHDQFAFDHSNVNKIIRLLKRDYRWSEMIKDVKQFIKNCHICKRTKTIKNKYNELLNFLSISNRSWIDITFDFVIELSDNRNYNAVFMIINRLSKMHHYIFCTTNENETTTEKTTKLFIQHVWKLHELLITMIFDRDSQFIFLIWDIICKMLKIKAKLFIAFHSKTNEQNEIFNQKMKRYLRVYVNHQQNDWTNWLFMTKYAFNAFISIIIQMSSFLANYEFESRMNFDQMKFDENIAKNRVNKFRKKEIVFIMKNIWKFAKKHMKKSQQSQVIYVNKHRIFALDY